MSKQTRNQKIKDSSLAVRNPDTSSKIMLDVPEASQMNILTKDSFMASPTKEGFPGDIPSPDGSPIIPKKRKSDQEEFEVRPHRGVRTNRDILEKLKALHKLRGWALIFPFLLSIFIIIQEQSFNVRAMYYLVVVAICVWCFVGIRSLKRDKNYWSMGLATLSLLICIYDFCVQFGIIGSEGWPTVSVYQFCFGSDNPDKDPKFKENICKGFNFLYYGDLMVYVFLTGCFSTFLYASRKLLSITRHVQTNGSYMVQLEDEMEEE